jgi:EAL domain-containing protein (putative c-di-GMP-specific phosphodiesterase class I)
MKKKMTERLIAQIIEESEWENLFTGLEIKSLFQPLYSVREKKYIGAEVLSRGLMSGRILPAVELFNLPRSPREAWELNKMCICRAMKAAPNHIPEDQLTLFVNIDSALMDHLFQGEKDFLGFLDDYSTDRIVIELIESRVKEFERLKSFVDMCRERGFLIALDDVGSGYSSLERLVKIKPDIIKIDKGLIRGISQEFYKKEVCRSLIELSHHIGALSLAEGVETLEEALECQNLGVDMIQGFYFSRPVERFEQINIDSPKVLSLVESWNISTRERARAIGDSLYIAKKQALKIHEKILEKPEYKWDESLQIQIEKLPHVECAYILNQHGRQISMTAMNSDVRFKKHFLFSPAEMGTDHSQKRYFMRRGEKQKWYISDPYISRATGNIVRTISLFFTGSSSEIFFLCLDIKNRL